MKNKKAIYILIPAVLFIWGIIFYKIYSKINHNNNAYSTNIIANKKQENFLSKTDDYKLQCDYSDPFLGVSMKRENMTSLKGKFAKKNNQNIIWPDIKVSGYVENAKNKKIKFWVAVSNNSYLMALGDTIKSIKLFKIWHDSVQFEYEGAHKNFKVNK
jgi:hypothetical protein